ncbi:uncharacterized protein LOC132167413 [Corylus avellana]|uniref:uncharacterized protein LOC132167413 n=1 Tax=Corylus avellana TaxID=13451 RepID=UPI00286BE0DE|nr:uncharacterized protein LOC132167413 [Corylus avellana]
MGKPNTILELFKRKNAQSSNANVGDTSSPTSDIPISENSPKKPRRVDANQFDISSLEYDPGLRRQIWDYDVNQRDEIRRAYIKAGPYRRNISKYPKSGQANHLRSFQPSWFLLFPTWLEYSPDKDAAFCLPCFLFSKPSGHPTQRLKASIDVVRVLAFQGVAFRGRDESISEVIAKAPKNASYTSPTIQKEILHVFSTKVKEAIRDEIGDAKFCIIVDEARDESMKEQMAIVLRFVDKNGFVRERFFGLVHVSDTVALTLKKCIYFVLSQHRLDIQNIRGQGYDGASNMRGELNGLQALVSNDCPYAYYIHCFAHRLQLALVTASKEVISIHQFFTNLSSIVNIVCASCNRFEELRVAQAAENAYMIEIDEIETERGLNQISTVQRAADTRWSSHLRSVSNLIKIFSPACEVIVKLIDMGTTSSH